MGDEQKTRAELPPLLGPCPHCWDGTQCGDERGPRRCQTCNGTGRVPTAAGRQVVEFLRACFGLRDDRLTANDGRTEPMTITQGQLPRAAATPTGPVDHNGIPFFPDPRTYVVGPVPDVTANDLRYLMAELLGIDFAVEVLDLAERAPGAKRDAAWVGIQWRLLRAAARLAHLKAREPEKAAECREWQEEREGERFDGQS